MTMYDEEGPNWFPYGRFGNTLLAVLYISGSVSFIALFIMIMQGLR